MNAKPSITGSQKYDKLFAKQNEETDAPPKDPEVWESPGRELRTTRHQVFSVQLIHRDGTLCMIPYSTVESGSGKYNGDKFTFRFVQGETLFEVTIQGTIAHTQRVVDYFCAGKAEMIRANGEEIRSITWEPVAEEAE